MWVIEDVLYDPANADRTLIEVLSPGGGVARKYSYGAMTCGATALVERLSSLKNGLRSNKGEALRVGVVCGNTPAFVMADLACLIGRAVEVPVPLAFSRAQAESLLGRVDVCLVDDEGAARLEAWGEDLLPSDSTILPVNPDQLIALASDTEAVAPASVGGDGDWICKVIHTSGTTSRPKGVRIRALGLNALLCSLRDEMPKGAFRRYLSTVPLSLLIEQVTGLYMVLLHGGTLVQLPPSVPLVGTTMGAAAKVMPFLRASRPTALVATPSLVEEVRREARGLKKEDIAQEIFGSARVPLICCGGAPIEPAVLTELDEMGIPVYEGYGLSENGSVVTWNRPDARRFGTVGKPLPHVRVRIADDGEVLVKSTSLFAGYTVDDPSSCVVDQDGWLHTGDIGELDGDGFLKLTGRKKNVIITSAGRNVAPEWVEAEYATLPFVRAVAVVGNHLPALHGLFLVDPGQNLDEARAMISEFGAKNLSEVERVGVAHIRHGREDIYRRFFTVTGRPMRAALEKAILEGTLDTQTQQSKAAGASRAFDMTGYGRGPAALVTSRSGGKLDELDPRWIISELARRGCIVFRGFDVDLGSFSDFVTAHSSRVTLDPARAFHGGKVAQKVDAGVDSMGLHIENGNSPFRPDLTWFFCEQAAREGSQTTICDGYRVWEKASALAREHFEGKDIVYHRRVEEAKWKTFVFHNMNGKVAMEDIDAAQLLALVNDEKSTSIELNADKSIYYTYRTQAVHPTLFDTRLAWANSIFGPSYNYEAPRISYADGRDLHPEALEEMRALTAELTEDINWQDGDVALVDNTRVMHGRRAIVDAGRRKIYNAQSYLNRTLL